jgi:hypothetical protein
MTRKEQLLLPAGMMCLFGGLMLKRYGGESYPLLALQIALFGVSSFLNIRYMLKHRADRSRIDGDG